MKQVIFGVWRVFVRNVLVCYVIYFGGIFRYCEEQQLPVMYSYRWCASCHCFDEPVTFTAIQSKPHEITFVSLHDFISAYWQTFSTCWWLCVFITGGTVMAYSSWPGCDGGKSWGFEMVEQLGLIPIPSLGDDWNREPTRVQSSKQLTTALHHTLVRGYVPRL